MTESESDKSSCAMVTDCKSIFLSNLLAYVDDFKAVVAPARGRTLLKDQESTLWSTKS